MEELNVSILETNDYEIEVQILEPPSVVLEIIPDSTPLTIQIGGRVNTSSNESNSIKIPFFFGDASPRVIFTALSGTLLQEVNIIITTPFNTSDTNIDVGDDIDPSSLINNSQVYVDEVGIYTSTPMRLFKSPTPIYLSINLDSGTTQGAGFVLLNF